MILNQPGQVFIHGPFQQPVYIGQQIVANDNSDYVGLTGEVTQIVDGEDLETENAGPDIYCSFVLQSTLNEFIAPLVKQRLNLPEDVNELDEIIMSLDMIEPKMRFQTNPLERQLYILTCFIENHNGSNDFMLLTSHDHTLLKKRLYEHAEQNEYLAGKKDIWRNESDEDGVFRLSFEDNVELQVCYSIIPVNYEWRDTNAQ